MREALDVLEPYCQPEWRISGFRDHLQRHDDFGTGPGAEGQQQSLRVYFSGIHTCVRRLFSVQVAKLNYQYQRNKDTAIKAEIDRLTAELARLPERWEFVAR